MKYYVTLNKKYQYVRVYNILKKINDSSNRLSRAVASLVDRYLLKKKKEEQEFK